MGGRTIRTAEQFKAFADKAIAVLEAAASKNPNLKQFLA
jgi:hypothetical protein